MKKPQTAAQKKNSEQYMADYKEMVSKLHILSRMSVRQFLGTRVDGDPRVDYLTSLESFKNLANVQLSVLLRLATEKLGIKTEAFLALSKDELSQQLKSMEESLAVICWNKDGTPKLDLQAHLKNTQGWPL